MSLRRWTDAVGPPLLATAIAVVLVVPAVAGPPARSQAAKAAPLRTTFLPLALPTCRPSPRPNPVPEAAPVRAAWYRLDPVLNSSGGLDAQRLVVGRVGRRGILEVPLAIESFASGPSDGRLLVGNDDGRRSTVRILDIDGRCASVVHDGRELVRRAVFDPAGVDIVEFRLDRSSRADVGVWSQPLDGSTPRRILDPLAPNERIGRVFSTELSWSLEGKRLIVTSCGEAFCLARILDRQSGRISTVDDPRIGDVLGLVGDELVAYGGCPVLPCRIVALDLRTGRLRVLAARAGLAVVSGPAGEPAIAFEDYEADGRLRSVRLDGTGLRTLPLGEGQRLVPAAGRALAAFELPAGVLAVAEGGRPSGAPVAASFIDLAEGRYIPAAEVSR